MMPSFMNLAFWHLEGADRLVQVGARQLVDDARRLATPLA
jgi:hypothetical protein